MHPRRAHLKKGGYTLFCGLTKIVCIISLTQRERYVITSTSSMERIMKREYSTFDIVKGLRINRNTLQSAIDGKFIVPDIQKAKGKGDKSLFSLEGVYTISLFMKMLQCGRSRQQAAEEANIGWGNVGTGQDQFKYLLKVSRSTHPNLLEDVGVKTCSELPKGDMADNELFLWIINLVAIKKQVDERLKE